MGAIGYISRSPLVRIAGNVDRRRYISDVLRPVAVPYLRGLRDVIFQQDIGPHVVPAVPTFLDTEGVRLLPRPARSPDLSPIENIWSWVVERLSRHHLPATTIDELWHRVEAEWNDEPVSVIQAQFDSMPSRITAVVASRGGNSVY